MSGFISDVDGALYAYIATVVVDKNAPPSTGSYIANVTLEYLKKMGVIQVNLGTQTAERFYKKQGFKVKHHIIENLRHRKTPEGLIIHNNLVIMANHYKMPQL